MSDILYEDKFLRITTRALEVGPTTYPLAKIVSVRQPLQLPMAIFGGVLLNGAVGIAGLAMVAQFSAIWSSIGALLVLTGVVNVKSEFNRPWWITVELANGESLRLERHDKEQIAEIYDALRHTLENH